MSFNRLTSSHHVPVVDAPQMRLVDRAMVEDYGITLLQMMENAGRNLAILARRRFFAGNPVGGKVLVLAGSGGNGGGAMAAARHLHNWGAHITLVLSHDPQSLKPVTRHQWDILRRMALSATHAPGDAPAECSREFDLILDGLIGYSLDGPPTGIAARLIGCANENIAPVLALDVPSGFDATSGTAHGLIVKAAATMTLALPKRGLDTPEARAVAGELYLADIGVPPALYQRPDIGLDVGPLFAHEDIIRL